MLFAARMDDGGDLRPHWVCPNAERILGFELNEIERPEWWVEGIHPDDRERIRRGRREVLSRDSVNLEYRFTDAAGEYRWIHAELRNVSRDFPDLELVGSWTDVTRRKWLEERLRDAQKMQAVGRLAAGVAHDFNNLLTTVLGNLDLARSDVGPDHAAAESLAEAAQAATHGAELTRKLLHFGGQGAVELRAVRVGSLLRSLEPRIRSFLPADIEYGMEAASDLPAAWADREHLREAVVNLVTNARDALSGGGSITIRAGVEEHPGPGRTAGLSAGHYVTVAVEDDGSGIPEEDRASLFEPFFTTRGPGAGSGLGLALVHETARECGGDVRVESEVGQGTRVTLLLPVAEDDGDGAPEKEGG